MRKKPKVDLALGFCSYKNEKTNLCGWDSVRTKAKIRNIKKGVQ